MSRVVVLVALQALLAPLARADVEAHRARAGAAWERAGRELGRAQLELAARLREHAALVAEERALQGRVTVWNRHELDDVRERLGAAGAQLVTARAALEDAKAELEVRRLALLDAIDRWLAQQVRAPQAQVDAEIALLAELEGTRPEPPAPQPIAPPRPEGLAPAELERALLIYEELAVAAEARAAALAPGQARLARSVAHLERRVGRDRVQALVPRLDRARDDLARLDGLIARERARAADHRAVVAGLDRAAQRALARPSAGKGE